MHPFVRRSNRTSLDRTWLVRTLSLVAILATGSVFLGARPSSAAPPNSPDQVQVINSTASPVPVVAQGTTPISGVVKLDPTANDVVIANTAPIPVALPGAGGELVQFEEFIALEPDGPPVVLVGAFEVPDGKRLVIEHVTGAVAVHPEQRIQVRIGQANGLHFLPLQLDPNAESDTFVNRATGSEAVTWFVDDTGPNALEVKIQVLREGPRVPVAAPAIITVVGRLYDL